MIYIAYHSDYGYELDRDSDLNALQERLDADGIDDYRIEEVKI